MSKEIIEGNELIAQFMNLAKCRRCGGNCDHYAIGSVYCSPEDLGYHKAWDAIMPVVEKICKIEMFRYEDEGVTKIDTAYPRTFGMIDEAGNFMVRFNGNTLHHAPTLIEATYNAVVDFITWHNTNKPTTNEQ